MRALELIEEAFGRLGVADCKAPHQQAASLLTLNQIIEEWHAPAAQGVEP